MVRLLKCGSNRIHGPLTVHDQINLRTNIRLPIRLLKFQNPGSRVALNWLNLCLGLKNMAITLVVLRHVQGDLCVRSYRRR